MEYSRHAPVPQSVRGGFGFWVLGFGFWVLGFGFWVLGFGFWVLGFGFWVLSLGFWVLGFCVRSRSTAAPLTLPPPPQVQLELVAAYQKRRAAGEKK